MQAWDRYAYTNNNPITYNDPSGHCLILCTAVIGAIIGFTANYAIQTMNNLNSGMNIGQAASWSNIDHQELAVATVGGFVGGLTLGLSTAVIGAIGLTESVATASTAIVGGAASNVFAGQAEALTNAAIDQVRNNTTIETNANGQGVINFSPNQSQFASDAKNYGFMNGNTILHDAVVGGFVGGVSMMTQGVIRDAGTPGALFLSKQPASWIRPASRAVDYSSDMYLEYEKENRH